jgi:MYXO-CTERM domain-containing protein
MTLRQLLSLVDRHRLATASSHEPHSEPTAPDSGGFGLLGMAALGRT